MQPFWWSIHWLRHFYGQGFNSRNLSVSIEKLFFLLFVHLKFEQWLSNSAFFAYNRLLGEAFSFPWYSPYSLRDCHWSKPSENNDEECMPQLSRLVFNFNTGSKYNISLFCLFVFFF